jgi:hypothetical protein
MFKNFINRSTKPSFATILWKFIGPYLQNVPQNFPHLVGKTAILSLAKPRPITQRTKFKHTLSEISQILNKKLPWLRNILVVQKNV